ncbi:glycosyltransferase [Thermaerobacter subterraneus DSM 13965]|uniref:Glycosyltransferase n=1 Tax=Thermaerobacter subterraneus DSM 13965 TaxID=867903 RepID=K6PZA8_9FIRM|nr:glycosyltransferase [Thermaerobacter subterraneus DSM 13965]
MTLPQEGYLNFGPWPLPAAGVLAGLLAAGGDRWLWRRGARRSCPSGGPPGQHRHQHWVRGMPGVARPPATSRSEGGASQGFRTGARLTVASARRLHPGIPPVLPGGPGWVYAVCALFAAGGFVKEPGATLQWTLAYLFLGGAVDLAARAVTRAAAPRTKGVVILRSNPVAPDPRVERVARTLARGGFKVTVVGWDREGAFPELEGTPFGILVRLRTPGRYGGGTRNLPALLRWQLHLVYWLLFHRRYYSMIHACDFDTLVPALLVKLLLGKRVVYDIFDWCADTVRGLPGFLRRCLARVDRWLLGWADAVILADDNRLPQLGKARPRRLEIVYNSPDWDPKDVIRGLPPWRGLRLAYIGLLQADRGLLELLEVMRRHPEWELDLGGFGAEEYLIRKAAAALPNVRFRGRVPHHRCMEVYVRADVLLATYDPSVPNYRYSSPNKLFEAMRLGKPIVVAEGTGIDRRVKAWELGYVVPYGDTDSLETALQDAAGWTGEERRAFAVRARRIYDEHFSWRIMSQRLLGLYDDMLTSIAPPTSSP